jgi:hypothetical protein
MAVAPPSAFTAGVSPQQAALYRQVSTPEGYAAQVAALRNLANAPASANAIAGSVPRPATTMNSATPAAASPLPGLPDSGLPNPTQGPAWGAGQPNAMAPAYTPAPSGDFYTSGLPQTPSLTAGGGLGLPMPSPPGSPPAGPPPASAAIPGAAGLDWTWPQAPMMPVTGTPLSASLGMPGVLPDPWSWQTRYGP